MALNIGRALREGIARTVARNGLLVAALMAVSTALSLLAYNSALESVLPDAPDQAVGLVGPTLPLSPLVASVATVVLYLVSFVVVAIALRTFVTGETRRIPGEYVTRNLGWMLLNYVVGYVVFYVALWIGFIFLFVPGLFLLVSLYFWFVLVAVEDQNFVEAFRNSWGLASGNRWSLLGLGLIVMVVGGVVYGTLFVATLAVPPWVELVVFAAIGGAFAVFSVATTARAYVQLADEAEATDGAAAAV